MTYSYEYLAFLREKILEYLPSTFKEVGGKYNGRCPFCGDSKKSSFKKRGWWYASKDASYFCFNCGISMSGIQLLKALSGEDYNEIRKEYVKLFLKSGLDTSLSSFVDESSNDRVDVFNFKQALPSSMKAPLTPKAEEYLKSRKVLEAPFLKEKLFSLKTQKANEEFILIPWKINGIDAYYQLNDFMHIKGMKYMFPKGKKKLLYGLDNIDPTYKKIFVFEGVYDSVFVKNGIASGTKSITQYQLDIIKCRWPNHEVVVSFDNDESGFASMANMIDAGDGFRFLKWFNEGTQAKDINELVLASNDARMFSDKSVLDSFVIDSLAMKLWMMRFGKWECKNKQKDFYASQSRKSVSFLDTLSRH